MLGELRRAVNRSSDRENIFYSILLVMKRFLINDYPIQFLSRILQHFNQTYNTEKPNNNNNYYYVPLPYVNDSILFKLNKSLKKLKLHHKIRYYFVPHRNLYNTIRPQPDLLYCTGDCLCCKMSNGRICFMKNVLYLITCHACKSKNKYIGWTIRPTKVRLNEHIRTDKESAVYGHHQHHHKNTDPILLYTIVNFGIYVTRHCRQIYNFRTK